MGFLGAIGLTAGLIPQYIEIWRLKEGGIPKKGTLESLYYSNTSSLFPSVRGISFIFLAVDISGGIFALISLAFKQTFDYIGALNYIGIVVAELGIFALALVLNPRSARDRLRRQLESGGDNDDADADGTALPPQAQDHETGLIMGDGGQEVANMALGLGGTDRKDGAQTDDRIISTISTAA
ncbi:hypothetical protein CF326_g2521 [Tilletia indica]|nr:hypothetical protein CF326_g2521 [Tilletia indica]